MTGHIRLAAGGQRRMGCGAVGRNVSAADRGPNGVGGSYGAGGANGRDAGLDQDVRRGAAPGRGARKPPTRER